MRRWNKRGPALLLTAALIFSQLGGVVLAQSGGGLCPHHPIHDAACGFEPGQLCAFDCADCADGDSGRAARVIAAFEPLEPSSLTRVVPIGTALDGLALPTSLRGTLTETSARGDTDSGTLDSGAAPDAETATVEPIRWAIDPANPQNAGASEYAPTGGVFYFTAVLPQGWRLASDATPPELCVIVRDNVILPPFGRGTENRPTHVEGEAVIVYELPDGPNRRSSAASLTGGGLHIEELMRLDDAPAAVADRAPSAKGLPRAAVSRRIAHVTGNGQSTEALIAELASYDFVEVAEPNYIRYPTAVDTDHPYGKLEGSPIAGYSDPYRSALWPLWGDFGVELPSDPITPTPGKAPPVIVIYDTGVDATHPDLAAMMLKENGKDVFFDPYKSGISVPVDDDGHGTHCAGSVAAKANNGIGIAGVAGNLPGVKLMSVRALGPNGGYTSEMIKGLDFIAGQVDKGRNIVAINASLGGSLNSRAEELAIHALAEKDILMVAAAGNENQDMWHTPSYPACYDLPNIVTVGAHDLSGTISGFSNYGRTEVDLTAPGSAIYSTVPKDALNLALQEQLGVSEGTVMTFDTMTESELEALKHSFTLIDAKRPKQPPIPVTVSLAGPADAAFGTGQALALTFDVPEDNAVLQLVKLPPPGDPASLPADGLTEALISAKRDGVRGADLGTLSFYTIEDGKKSRLSGFFVTTDLYGYALGERPGLPDGAQLSIYEKGPMTLLLDNYGCGVVNNEDGAKYNLYMGTSMAAPAVTGVVAALAVAEPELSYKELRARIIGSASQPINRETKDGGPAVKGIASGGVSLNNAINGQPGSFAPVIDSHTVAPNGDLILDGWYLGGDPIVTINTDPDDERGQVLTAGKHFNIATIGSKGQYKLTIYASALAPHASQIREIAIEQNGRGAYRMVELVHITEPEYYLFEAAGIGMFAQMKAHRVDDTLYIVAAQYDPSTEEVLSPVVYSHSATALAKNNILTPLAALDCLEARTSIETELYGGRIYLPDQKHLHIFDLKTTAWLPPIDLPAEIQGIVPPRPVVLDGKLILMGGAVAGKDSPQLQTAVGLYDLATKTWSVAPNFLPIPAADGKAVAAGGTIYYQPLSSPVLLAGSTQGLSIVANSPAPAGQHTIAPWGGGVLYLGQMTPELGETYTYQGGSWKKVELPFDGRGGLGFMAIPWKDSLMVFSSYSQSTIGLQLIPGEIPAPTQLLRVTGAASATVDGAPLTPGKTFPAGKTVTVTATDSYGQAANGWTAPLQALTLTPQPNGAVRFVMPPEEVTLRPSFPSSGGGGGGGGGGGSPAPAPKPTPTTPPEPNVSSSPVAAPPDANGTAKVAPDAASLTKSLDALKAQPGKPGAERVLELVPETGGAAARLELTLTPEAQKLLASAPMDSLSLRAKEAELRLPRTLLMALQGISTGDIGFAVEGVRPAPAQSWQLAGRPLYELSSHVTGTGGQRLAVSDFGQPMTLALPYALRPGETAAQITLLQVNPDGSMTAVPGAVYNPASGKVVASVSRPGRYAVGLPPSGGLAPLAPLPTAGGYTVGAGDSFWAIAQRHGVDMNALAAANGKKIGDLLRPGEKLVIPGK